MLSFEPFAEQPERRSHRRPAIRQTIAQIIDARMLARIDHQPIEQYRIDEWMIDRNPHDRQSPKLLTASINRPNSSCAELNDRHIRRHDRGQGAGRIAARSHDDHGVKPFAIGDAANRPIQERAAFESASHFNRGTVEFESTCTIRVSDIRATSMPNRRFAMNGAFRPSEIPLHQVANIARLKASSKRFVARSFDRPYVDRNSSDRNSHRLCRRIRAAHRF